VGGWKRCSARPSRAGRVIAPRAAALSLGALVLIGASHFAVVVATRLDGIALDPGRLALGSAMWRPVALSFGAVGAWLVGYRPRAAVVALSALALASFLDPYFAPVFKAPAWVVKLSIFDLYGVPLADGPSGGGRRPWPLSPSWDSRLP